MSTPIDATGVSPAEVKDAGGFFGHPRGLSTLFFTEMWERFSFYGLRAILFLYMTTEISKGGLAFERPYAGLIMGTYTSGVYWTPLLGGWIADKWLGARRAVLVGRNHHRLRSLLDGHSVHAHLLFGPGADRPRHRLFETKRQHDGRRPLR